MKVVYSVLALLFIGLIGQGIYQQITKRSIKSNRLECHKNITMFENLKNEQLLKELKSELADKNYQLVSSLEKATYMKSQLFNHISLKEVDSFIYRYLGEPTGNKVTIEYRLYENDKLNPGKKTEASKKFAGYINFQFILNKTLVYQSQIDFMQLDGSDIEQRVQCAIESIQDY